MSINAILAKVTDNIRKRSEKTRGDYLSRTEKAVSDGPVRAKLSCGNQAHVCAPMGGDKPALAENVSANLGIVTAYNDMLSAHQPFQKYPDLIKHAVREAGGTAQVAGGVPAMCDGVTQGQPGMELSLFSRDTIAMSAGIALSHNAFDSSVYLGVCDKIVPGLVIAASTFGHLPAVFLPAGPMPSGLPNFEKTKVRQAFASGKVGRKELLEAEMASYHDAGTCTFYGTANTNQMLMEFMGLHLPSSSFVNPNTALRKALTIAGAQRALAISALGDEFTPVSKVLDEKAYVNGVVGLMATGGSTNLLIHLLAMARSAGIILNWGDFAEISKVVPLLARVYPNGSADVNHFHAAGGLGYLIGQLLNAGLLHDDTHTIMGTGLEEYTKEPKLIDGKLTWVEGASESLNTEIVASTKEPFSSHGGLASFEGNLGSGVMKVSAVAEDKRSITAPVRVFHSQDAVIAAFKAGEFTQDVIVVVRYQGPKSNGMPELHGLTPSLAELLDSGIKVALLTDGRMSGASGKVPAVIHTSPEALDGGPIAYLQDGDVVTIDAEKGVLKAADDSIFDRPLEHPDLSANQYGIGRELFELFRKNTSPAEQGASIFTF